MATSITKPTPRRKRLPRRDRGERFISRQELAERWSISVREIIVREKSGALKPYRFSYKMTRFKLSDIVALEESASQLPTPNSWAGWKTRLQDGSPSPGDEKINEPLQVKFP